MTIIIGDMGSNHLGNLVRAKEMVCAFAEAGGTIFKGQLFKPEQYPHNIVTPIEWIEPLMETAGRVGVGLLFSVFYPLLSHYDLGAVKIAYSQRHNFPLIKHFQDRGDRLIVSGDHNTWWPNDCIKLLCVPEYPASYDTYLRNATSMEKEKAFAGYDGVSDHTNTCDLIKKFPWRFVEKHFKLGDEGNKSPDAGDFAIKPDELRELVKGLNQ